MKLSEDKIETQLGIMKKRFAEMGKAVVATEAQIQTGSRRREDTDGVMAEVKEKFDAMHAAKKASAAANEQLVSKLAEANEALETSAAASEQLAGKLAEADGGLEASAAKIQAIKDQLGEADIKAEVMQAKVGGMENEISSLTGTVTKQTQAHAAAKQALEIRVSKGSPWTQAQAVCGVYWERWRRRRRWWWWCVCVCV